MVKTVDQVSGHEGVDAMPDSNVDEAREALLVKADEAWPHDPGLDSEVAGDTGGNVVCYLRAYYQRVATEDLASPTRMAGVAEAHARFGLRRPQGRALVQVREPGDTHPDPGTASSLVVDIVVGDMPYLVDSVTTELNRHEAEIQLLLHPVLHVRRDVTGALQGILPPVTGAGPAGLPGGYGGAGSPPVSGGGRGGGGPPGGTGITTEAGIHVGL